MLFTPAAIEGIAAGRITVAVRRWDKVRVNPGSRIRNARGVVEIVSIEKVDAITEADAQAAGFGTAAELMKLVDKKSKGGELYRVGVRYGGEDPRKALRENTDDAELDRIRTRLKKMDATEPWTRTYLKLIRDNPAIVSTALAAQVDMPRPAFKIKVRKLKDLGLTESLEIGYRLSARGRAVLDADEA